MAKSPRFRNTGKGSFFGDFLYQSVVQRHRDHFLVALYHLFDWSAWSQRLVALYKGQAQCGAPPYDPVLMFKLLFLAYLYDTSERAIVEQADLNLLLKWFLGLAVDAAPPDHSSLTVFKKRLQEGSGWATLQGIFADLIQQARAQGLEMGAIQVLDSVHTCADVDTAKERERHAQGQPPRDPDARVVHKGRRRVVSPEGQSTLQEVTFMGYKTHASVNAETGIVTAIVPALGNTADNKAFPALRDQDRALGLPTEIYAGDRAYDDTDIHDRLEAEGLVRPNALHFAASTSRPAARARRTPTRSAGWPWRPTPATRRGAAPATAWSRSSASPSAGTASGAVVTWGWRAIASSPP